MVYFYIQYFIRKIAINIFEIKKNTINVYLSNLLYMFTKITGGNYWKKFSNIDYSETIFGKFFIKPNSQEIITISPDFERTDIDYLLLKIEENYSKYKNSYFIDVGANFGLYSVIVGNKFNDKIKIIGFEPFKDSFDQYNKNLRVNKINNFKIFCLGLYNKDSKLRLELNTINPGGNSIGNAGKNFSEIDVKEFKKIEAEITYENSIAFIKMDIEGSETQALQGMDEALSRFDEVLILIEDFIINPEEELRKQKFKFEKKLSPYNSFWRKINIKN